MTTGGIPRPLVWREPYHLAMLEPDRIRLAPLLDDAINTVLDRIEEINTYDELEELNNALNDLRLRRKPRHLREEWTSWQFRRIQGSLNKRLCRCSWTGPVFPSTQIRKDCGDCGDCCCTRF